MFYSVLVCLKNYNSDLKNNCKEEGLIASFFSATPVQDLSVYNKSATELSVNWTKPETNCILTYEVSYNGTAKWGDGQQDNNGTDGISTGNTSIILTDLMPYSDYTVCVVTNSTNGLLSSESCSQSSTLQGSKYRSFVRSYNPKSTDYEKLY